MNYTVIGRRVYVYSRLQIVCDRISVIAFQCIVVKLRPILRNITSSIIEKGARYTPLDLGPGKLDRILRVGHFEGKKLKTWRS